MNHSHSRLEVPKSVRKRSFSQPYKVHVFGLREIYRYVGVPCPDVR